MDSRRGQEAPLPLPRTSADSSFATIKEVWLFVRATGKWWLVPVLVVLALLGALVLLSGTGCAPFLYTLF